MTGARSDMPVASSVDGEPCSNCGTALTGRWCHACGQKQIAHADRQMRALVAEAAREVTNVDGRFLRSLRALLLRPGLLSRDWIEGRRARWMSPMGVFLFANVLYFLAPGLTDFNLPFSDHVNGRMLVELAERPEQFGADARRRLESQTGQRHTAWTAPMVERRIAERDAAARAEGGAGYTLRDYAREYDARAGNVGKALIAAHLPVLAWVLMMVFRSRRLFFAEHLVVALHAFAFLLLFVELVVLPGALLVEALGVAPSGFPGWAKLTSAAIVVAYLGRTFQVAYGARWWHSALAVVAWVVGLGFANLWMYRTLQFLVTFAVT